MHLHEIAPQTCIGNFAIMQGIDTRAPVICAHHYELIRRDSMSILVNALTVGCSLRQESHSLFLITRLVHHNRATYIASTAARRAEVQFF